MNIASQLQQISVFFTDNRFITILEKMPTPLMTSIEVNGISGHETSHDFAKWGRAYSQKEVKMVRNQGPCIALRLGFLENECEPLQKRCAVVIVSEDLSSFDASGHDVLEKARGVKSGLSWHSFQAGLTPVKCALLVFCEELNRAGRIFRIISFVFSIPRWRLRKYNPLSAKEAELLLPGLFYLFDRLAGFVFGSS